MNAYHRAGEGPARRAGRHAADTGAMRTSHYTFAGPWPGPGEARYATVSIVSSTLMLRFSSSFMKYA
jgi:hypothetical protein